MANRWRRVGKWVPLATFLAVGLTGCGFLEGPQSMVQPAGPVAQDQLQLIGSSFWIMVEIFLVVATVLVLAIIRFRERPGQRGLPPQTEGDNRLELLWTIVPFLLLALLAVGTVKQSFSLSASPATKNALPIKVVGHQFWWSVQYPTYNNLTTANEIHIPVGQKVLLELTSTDVLHAFWVPRLGGKTDLVPGKTNYMWIEADQPGIYRGQCAEFCGTAHADMRLVIDAQTPQQFAAWTQAMLHPQSTPTSALAQQGMIDFAKAGCSGCHTIAGTNFEGQVGPNLTDLTGRLMIAGNLVPNTPANLAAWIRDPQAVKPGALMPNLHLPENEIRAIVAYLESLR